MNSCIQWILRQGPCFFYASDPQSTVSLKLLSLFCLSEKIAEVLRFWALCLLFILIKKYKLPSSIPKIVQKVKGSCHPIHPTSVSKNSYGDVGSNRAFPALHSVRGCRTLCAAQNHDRETFLQEQSYVCHEQLLQQYLRAQW